MFGLFFNDNNCYCYITFVTTSLLAAATMPVASVAATFAKLISVTTPIATTFLLVVTTTTP
eukprot:3417608-Ditylum_brightwellii.AAC.1